MNDRATSSWTVSRRVFLCGLGVVYVVAFLSLWVQVEGLYGARGISSIADLMERVSRWDASALERVWRFPTVFWIGASDRALHATCAIGMIGSLLLVAGRLPRVGAGIAWGAYLSFSSVGYPFVPFQWDALLLEAGLLGWIYAPRGLRPFRASQRAPSRAIRFLLVWLLFRLVFNSGLVKLRSGDEVWRDLSALTYHYWTQPLPTALSHYAHHFGPRVGAVCCAVMFAIELGAPFLLFGPRRARIAGALAITSLMIAIAATGNYGFFNLLTVVLCVSVLDDRAIGRVLPFARTSCDTPSNGDSVEASTDSTSRWRTMLAATFVAVVMVTTARRAGWIGGLPDSFDRAIEESAQFASFNRYGLFADMTESRREIVVEGSDDGERWQRYAFRWKPGAVDTRPRFAHVHMPRLDWQMWFAALRGAPPDWYFAFCRRLLQASAEVLELLGHDPFDGNRPRYLRSTLYEYRFSSPDERASGIWWERDRIGSFGPVLELTADGRIRSAR